MYFNLLLVGGFNGKIEDDLKAMPESLNSRVDQFAILITFVALLALLRAFGPVVQWIE